MQFEIQLKSTLFSKMIFQNESEINDRVIYLQYV